MPVLVAVSAAAASPTKLIVPAVVTVIIPTGLVQASPAPNVVVVDMSVVVVSVPTAVPSWNHAATSSAVVVASHDTAPANSHVPTPSEVEVMVVAVVAATASVAVRKDDTILTGCDI